MSLFYFISLPAADDILLLIIFLALLMLVTLAGYVSLTREKKVESTLVTVCVLALTGLLTGFCFSVVINGYSARLQAQSRETLAISQAWQFAGLLKSPDRDEARRMLKTYLRYRIQFYREGRGTGLRTWVNLAQEQQQQLWQLAEKARGTSETVAVIPVLTAFSELTASLSGAVSAWHRHLPDAAWGVVLLFACCSGFLTGFRQPPGRLSLLFLFLVPLLTGITFFILAEIDIPGGGIIHVSADSLISLNDILLSLPSSADIPASTM